MQALRTRNLWARERVTRAWRAASWVAVTGLALLILMPGSAGAAGPGAIDGSFGSHGAAAAGAGSQLFGVAVASDGAVVAAGQTGGRVLVERFSASGGLTGRYVGPAGYARAVAIQPDGRIVVAGSSGGSILVERLTTGLGPDSSFGSGGVAKALGGASAANGVAIGPDGSIVAAGLVNPVNARFGVAKFSSGGGVQWSESLNYGPNSIATGVAVQPDGKVVLVGHNTPLQQTNAVVVRLNANGSTDFSFNGGAFTYHYPGSGYTALNSVALQNNGQIVAAGIALADTSNALFLRLNANGKFDSGFGSGGVRVLVSETNVNVLGDPIGAYGVGIAGGGRIVGAGNFENTGVEVDGALWALTPSGAPQAGFGNGGTVRGPSGAFEECGLAIAPDGSLVAVGNTVTSFPDSAACVPNGAAAGYAVRYGGFGPPPPGPGPGGPGALKVSFKGVAGTDKTSAVVKHGLKVAVNCNEACSVRLSLTISAGTAKRLHILTTFQKCTKVKGKKHCVKTHGYLPVTIASGRGSVGGSGAVNITLKLNHLYVKALQSQKSVGVTLQASVTSTATHKGVSSKKNITFKR